MVSDELVVTSVKVLARIWCIQLIFERQRLRLGRQRHLLYILRSHNQQALALHLFKASIPSITILIIQGLSDNEVASGPT